MIVLREIDLQNTEDLKENFYKNKTADEIKEIILSWKNKIFNGKYFEMLGVFNDKKLVGIVSIMKQTQSSVSFGIEVFERYRKLGYGYDALNLAFEKAKQNGFCLTVNQVRADNFASMALCKKCGLETNFYEYINKKGNLVYLYIKQL